MFRVSSLLRNPLLTLGCLLLLPARSLAQQCDRSAAVYSITGQPTELVRSASLIGQAPLQMEVLRRASRPGGFCVGPEYPGRLRTPILPNRVDLVPVSSLSAINSGYPRDANNGAFWAGKGVALGLSAGARFSAGVLSLGLQPAALFSSNGQFPLATSFAESAFGAPWLGGIDLPQRFGNDAFATFDAGTSYARIDQSGLAVGISTENVWWGPLRFFPLLMSNTAPGFPHVFLGTGKPVNIGIGKLDGELIWGRLSESEFFDSDDSNDRRLLSGIVIGFEPRGLKGLTIGAARAYHQAEPPDGFSVWEALRAPYSDVRTNFQGRDNNLLSLFLRWALVPAGFEFYAEWARDDHWQNTDDLIRELDHSQAYALGFQKIAQTRSAWYRIYGELAHLEAALPYRGGRGVVTFYQNGSVVQGHTQRGQMLGAWIGPGSDAQIFGIDRIVRAAELGGYLLRVRYNDDAYYNYFSPRYGSAGHDVELTGGARASWQKGPLDLELSASLSHRWNRALVNLENEQPIKGEWNLGLLAWLSWHPRRPELP